MFKLGTEIGQILEGKLFFIKIYESTLATLEDFKHLEVGKEYLARLECDSWRKGYDLVIFNGAKKSYKGKEIARTPMAAGVDRIGALLSTIPDENAFRNAANALTNYRDPKLEHIPDKAGYAKHHIIPVSLFNTKRLLIEVTSMGFFEVNQKENIRHIKTSVHKRGHGFYNRLVEEWIDNIEAEIDAVSDMTEVDRWSGDGVYAGFRKVLAIANAFLQSAEERGIALDMRDSY